MSGLRRICVVAPDLVSRDTYEAESWQVTPDGQLCLLTKDGEVAHFSPMGWAQVFSVDGKPSP